MRVHVALVLNPRSGSVGDPVALEAAVRRRCASLSVHAPGEHDAAVATRPDRLLVAGGDGTIAPCFAAAAGAGIPLGVLPGGTANDFARALGLPLDALAALDHALADRPATRQIWGGLIDGRPFVNVASMGLAADAARRAERLKRSLGPLAYPAGAVAAGLMANPARASLRSGGDLLARGRTWQLMVGASGRFGGGAGLGEADARDDDLVAAWVPSGSRAMLPLRAAGLLSRTIEQQPAVQWWRRREFTARAGRDGRPATWNVDGERWRPAAAAVQFRSLGPATVIVTGPSRFDS